MKKPSLADIRDAAALCKLPDLPLPDRISDAVACQQGAQSMGPLVEGELKALADLATNLWRAQKRLLGDGDVPTELKKHLRPVEAALESLERLHVKVTDHIGQRYDPGMPVKVISCQPKHGVTEPTVGETLKPTVSFREQVIQHADVTVDEPPLDSQKKEAGSGQTDV